MGRRCCSGVAPEARIRHRYELEDVNAGAGKQKVQQTPAEAYRTRWTEIGEWLGDLRFVSGVEGLVDAPQYDGQVNGPAYTVFKEGRHMLPCQGLIWAVHYSF